MYAEAILPIARAGWMEMFMCVALQVAHACQGLWAREGWATGHLHETTEIPKDNPQYRMVAQNDPKESPEVPSGGPPGAISITRGSILGKSVSSARAELILCVRGVSPCCGQM